MFNEEVLKFQEGVLNRAKNSIICRYFRHRCQMYCTVVVHSHQPLASPFILQRQKNLSEKDSWV